MVKKKTVRTVVGIAATAGAYAVNPALGMAVAGASAGWVASTGNKPSMPKPSEPYQFPTDYIQNFLTDPTKRFISPFGSLSQQFLFRQQQEDLFNLKNFVPKEKLGE